MLLSLCGNVEVCQIVDPMKTARFVVPKYVLAGLGLLKLYQLWRLSLTLDLQEK